MRHRLLFFVANSAALVLSGCGLFGHSGPHRPREAEWHPPVGMLLRYDFNHDGSVTRAEMEKGLHEDFAKADTNHDGGLDEGEVRAVNQQRWAEDASTASPLVDWNHDGSVDFDEFAATPRSLFSQMDSDGDGVLSPKELRPQPAVEPHKLPQDGPRRRRDGGDGDGDGY